jgi:type II secretory pathway component PulF
MPAATLDEFIAFNDQLAALIEAGVPIDLGLDGSRDQTTETLEKINALVARHVSRGATLAEAVDAAEPALPMQYRSLMQLWLRTGDIEAVLGSASQMAEAIDESRYGVRSAFFYPLVVCSLAIAGLIAFCIFLVPRLESLREEMRLPVASGLQTVQGLRDWLPFWVVPFGLVLLAVAWRLWSASRSAPSARRPRGLSSRLTGTSQAAFQDSAATFADSLATLLSAGVPLEEGLRVAAGSCGDDRLNNGAQAMTETLGRGRAWHEDAPAARQFPPFLRWALLESEPAVDRPRALHMAAEVYRRSAERLSRRARVMIPLVACVVVGGSAVLLYALALFVPLVEMVRGIASLH